MSAGAFLGCMIAVAQMHSLPPRVLPAIQATEGGWIGAIRPNTNGSEDLGLMQVNTVWLPAISRATGLSAEEVRVRLVYDGCFSVLVAGAILRLHLDAERGNLMRAIGNYHSRTGSRNQAYQERVIRSATRLFGGGGSAAAAAARPPVAPGRMPVVVTAPPVPAQPPAPAAVAIPPAPVTPAAPAATAAAVAQADAQADAQPDGPEDGQAESPAVGAAP